MGTRHQHQLSPGHKSSDSEAHHRPVCQLRAGRAKAHRTTALGKHLWRSSGPASGSGGANFKVSPSLINNKMKRNRNTGDVHVLDEQHQMENSEEFHEFPVNHYLNLKGIF